MKHKNYDPKTMKRANARDLFIEWRKYWGYETPKGDASKNVKRGSFYHLRANGFVYIAMDKNGELKIGGTHSITSRIKQLAREYGEMKVVAFIHADQYMYLERFLHQHLKDLSLRREWYPDTPIVFDRVRGFLKKHGEIFGAKELVVNYNETAMF